MTEIEYMPFQRKFLKNAMKPDVTIAAMSLARGNGKSTLLADVARRFLAPGDKLHVPGGRCLMYAASMGQSRDTTFGILESWLRGDDDYKIASSITQAHIVHKPTGTEVAVKAANPKTAQGIVNVSLIIGDEPGAWEINGGQAVSDALETALGKPGPAMKVIYIGTLGPLATHAGHWYYDMIAHGTDEDRGIYVMALTGQRRKWDRQKELKRVNPLMWQYPNSRRTLLQELKDAKKDTRLKARFLTYRLNVPTGDESTVLLTVDEWERVLDREPGEIEGVPVIGIDMGAGRAWCAAVAWWPNQRIEAFAVCPGIPSIAEQEERDIVPRGSYERLVDRGLLKVAEGYRIPPAWMVVQEIRDRWGGHVSAISDRFREQELLDAGMAALTARVTQWSEAAFDIRALRRAANDGELSVGESRALFEQSLSATMVEHDKAGNMRIIKKGFDNQGRDDVSAALALAAGEAKRLFGDWDQPAALPVVMQLA